MRPCSISTVWSTSARSPYPEPREGIADLRARETRVGFVTNNAARPPHAVAEHLRELGIEARDADVVTSAQAAAHLLWARFGPGARVLAVGGAGVWEALDEVGLIGVGSADDQPVAIIQGWGGDLTWNQLNEAAIAVHRGAYWVATNTDPTRPTDRGIVPGNGAAVAAVTMAVGRDPEVAGKPYRPLMDETVQRLGAAHPIFVGDRLDTDIAGAHAAGLDSMLVFTGAHQPADLLAADQISRPTHLGYDLRALLAPVRSARITPCGDDAEAQCGQQTRCPLRRSRSPSSIRRQTSVTRWMRSGRRLTSAGGPPTPAGPWTEGRRWT